MFLLWVALLAAVWMSSLDGVEAQNYTVHSTVIFSNTGERTPLLLPGASPQLTSLGAQQMFNLGSYFRRRYIESADRTSASSSVLTGLNSNRLNADQIYVQAIDVEHTITSATAFMQAFYPPNRLNNATAGYLEPSAVLADNTYVETPLNGYQYPLIHSVGQFDPYSIFLTGATNCPFFEQSAVQYYYSQDFNDTAARTRTMYQSIGHAVLGEVLPQSAWSFENGYLIYDYVSYMNLHNSSVKDTLSGPAYRGNLKELATLAAQKQSQIYGDLTASGHMFGDRIRAIAGRTLAARMLGLLMDNMGSRGTQNKFNLLVGDYSSMLSLFALFDVRHANDNFIAIPPFGSAFALELFSWQNKGANFDGNNYPSKDNMWVRFLYSNGSTTDQNPFPSVQAYPLFDRGPSETDMKWKDFQSLMLNIMLSDVSDWCTMCGEAAIFCPAFVDESRGSGSSSGSRPSRRPNSQKSKISPAVGGVIGAIVTLGIAGILFALVAFFFGVRVHRNGGKRTSDLGGFKGSRKLASDPDLNLPKHSAPPGIVAVEDNGLDKKSHERVGSWELGKSKDVERNTFSSLGGSTAASNEGRKPSFEGDFDHDDHDGINPFQEPTKVRESF
ncbi:phosphoglycerate mutase-like protein [Tothia fuscella]|uniref:Phosphoglycerate mutase-like protein n=1 Tax=Tothia fuscella TaxID=1048955 RepID=A0A9P4TY76_9PEZI|nr:phosphoglycerate mutase-like protein [Tothia fuscella]